MEIEHGGAVVVLLLLIDVEFVFVFKVFLSQSKNVLLFVCAFLAGSFFSFFYLSVADYFLLLLLLFVWCSFTGAICCSLLLFVHCPCCC